MVIEDDYDGEFRLGVRPLDALQTLDRDELVFYVGSFSKSLFPDLGLGFVVAPVWALNALAAAKSCSDWHCPALMQDTLAAFIAGGHLACHVRKMGKIYAERRTILLRALSQHVGEWVQPVGDAVGPHLTTAVSPQIPASELVATAAIESIRLQAAERYGTEKPALIGPVFGYGMIRAEHIDEGIHRLAQTICEHY